MSMFGAMNVAGSGLYVTRRWLDAVSDNIANINDARSTADQAFRARYLIAQSVGSGTGQGGVELAGVMLGDPVGRVVYEPDHPLADADGNVRYPDIDLGEQMSHLIMAQRGYQANLAVVDRARNAYEAALQLGRSA